MSEINTTGNETVTVEMLFELARRQSLQLGQLMEIAESWNRNGQTAAAAELYKTWIAFNDGNPLMHMAYFNYAVTLRRLNDFLGAVHALRACVQLAPLFGQGQINLGRALEDLGQPAQAIEQWKTYLTGLGELNADQLNFRLMAMKNIGRVFENAEQMADAESVLWQVIEMQPEKTDAGQHWTALRQRQCKWPILIESEHVTKRNLLDALSPLSLGCFSDDPLFQLAKAYRYNKTLTGRPEAGTIIRPPVKHKTGSNSRLKIGYVSSDLRDHAVGFALSELLEFHDKGSVEIYGYYCGEKRHNDPTQERMKQSIDHWRDIAELDDLSAARLIAEDEIDILVDVNGYTKHARTKIFSYRPAPVIVSFCGYPGTIASPYHQYLIADPVIVPEGSEIYYAEKVLHIACNQPVDRKRVINPSPSRAALGLPEDKFIFACFNGMQKITEACFKRWLAILTAAPNSVLWLLDGAPEANARLKTLFIEQGLAPERLIFAPKAANPDHLARIALADLFLDTFPYGAHSTASDAITMGLPVLTLPGKSFASRFCASIVTAAGVPDLICSSPEDYMIKAVYLASNPHALQEIRQSLLAQKEGSVLRDIPGLAKRLEELFWLMQGEAERGEVPQPNLKNLDIYYEVGAEMILSGEEYETEADYRARFVEKLTEWHAHRPIEYDNRLWKAPQ